MFNPNRQRRSKQKSEIRDFVGQYLGDFILNLETELNEVCSLLCITAGLTATHGLFDLVP